MPLLIHIETGKNLYGGGLQVIYLLRTLKDFNCKNILFLPQDSAILKYAKLYHINTIVFPFKGEADARLFLRLFNFIKRNKAKDHKYNDKMLLHIHSRRGADIWAPLAALASNVPYIITRRVDNPEPYSVSLLKYKYAGHVVCISQAIYDLMIKYGISENKLSIIKSAVDTTQFRPYRNNNESSKKSDAINDLIDDRHILIGMIAQFIRRKGHEYLIKSISKIIEDFPQCKFIFLGKGPLLNDMKGLANSLNVRKYCIFAGFRDDIEYIIPRLSILVHPAMMEGLGVSVLQAMACKVPVIATDAGGLKDIIIHNSTALLIKRNVDIASSISYNIKLLLKDKSLKEHLVSNAYNMIKKDFSLNTMAKRYWRIYNKIIP